MINPIVSGMIARQMVVSDNSPQTPKETKTTKSQEVSRVEELKEAVANGIYPIDIEGVAHKMAEELL